MGHKKHKEKKELPKPKVTICTPTFNRRPFFPMAIQCVEHQDYPKELIEWIIIDDGTDKVGDLVEHLPYVQYYSYDKKMTLGRKRNLTNKKATGDIIVYMDDDDYYPPERISHAVETLQKNPRAMCVGSSAMYLYFKHISKMYLFGPYGPNHATAASFAFRKELLTKTRFDETSSVAEEKKFLKDYTIPFAQLDPKKTILVFSHAHNSFDKRELLKTLPNPNIHETDVVPADIVKEQGILQFFMHDIDGILEGYSLGAPDHKPDVTKQLDEIRKERDRKMQEQFDYQKMISQVQTSEQLQRKIEEQSVVIQQLLQENEKLKANAQYLQDKMTQLIATQIAQRKTPPTDA